MNVLERAVLGLLLEHYPAHLSTAEIVLAMTTRPEDIAERDTIETALTSLRGYGLVHSLGSFWFPTLAATRFDALERRPAAVPPLAIGSADAGSGIGARPRHDVLGVLDDLAVIEDEHRNEALARQRELTATP